MNSAVNASEAATAPDSRYLDHLPAVMRTLPDDGTPVLNRLLRAFEAVLSGSGDPERPGLAEVIGGIPGATPLAAPRLAGLHRYFEPGSFDPGTGQPLPSGRRAPVEFLDWLSGWVGLSLRADLDEANQREFIAKAVSLYRVRGTPAGLEQVLRIYTRLGVKIDEGGPGFRVGTTATVGVDTIVGGFAPYHFEITLFQPASTPAADPRETVPEAVARYRRIATAIIEAEKPAHCTYRLTTPVPVAFQVGKVSQIGVDTLLGPEPTWTPNVRPGTQP